MKLPSVKLSRATEQKIRQGRRWGLSQAKIAYLLGIKRSKELVSVCRQVDAELAVEKAKRSRAYDEWKRERDLADPEPTETWARVVAGEI